jgi:replicative DNA helicase
MAAMKREGAEVVFVDHFGLLSTGEDENRVRELGRISWELRRAAKTLDLAVVGLYQLNRSNVVAKERPGLHSLRGSGEIEENATHAIFLHNATEQADTGVFPAARRMEWLIEKNRNGPRGIMDITSEFDPRYQTWA